jgi:hypothetical protein
MVDGHATVEVTNCCLLCDGLLLRLSVTVSMEKAVRLTVQSIDRLGG